MWSISKKVVQSPSFQFLISSLPQSDFYLQYSPGAVATFEYFYLDITCLLYTSDAADDYLEV